MTAPPSAPYGREGPQLRTVIVLTAAVLTGVATGPPRAGGVDADCAEVWRERILEGDDETRPASQTTLAIDVANNAYITRVIEGRIEVGIVGSSFETNLVVSGGPVAQSDPAVATNFAGVTYVAFSGAVGGETPDPGRDVFLARISGGSLGAPRNLSVGEHGEDDHGPRIALDQRGRAHLVWTRNQGEGNERRSGIVYWNALLGTPRTVSEQGESPSIFVDLGGRVHMAYLQGNDIAYLRGEGDAFEAEAPVTTSAFVRETSPSIAVDAEGTVMILYESQGDLYLTRKRDGAEFESPQLLEGGGVLVPHLKLTPAGDLLIAYTKDGDVYHLLGAPESLGDPVRITETESLETQPVVDIDSNGAIHVAFLRDSVARYATNACAPLVEFDAAPLTGRLPLTVRFTDRSGRTASSWEWDFGDGAVSRIQNPEHTYEEPGLYTVRLTVSAPGGVESTLEIEELIAVDDALNSLEIPDQQVIPGHRDIWFPVLATHFEPIQGFQLMGTYDPAFLRFVRTDLALTAIAAHDIVPEFLETRVYEAHFEVGCLFEIKPPFDGTVLPPSDRDRLANLVFDVSDSAPQGETTEVRLANDKKISRIFNIFVVGGFNRLPALKGATVKVRVIEPPFPKVFVRGDVDDDGIVTVNDAIVLLAFLFQGTRPPDCLDAADFNDAGRVDVTGVVGILNFLFGGGRAPGSPYPNRGLDPSDDALGECTS